MLQLLKLKHVLILAFFNTVGQKTHFQSLIILLKLAYVA